MEKTLQAAPFIAVALIIIGYLISYLPLRSIATRVADSFGPSELDVPGLALVPGLSKVLNSYLSKRTLYERNQEVLFILLKYSDVKECEDKLHSIYQLYNECHYVLHESDAHRPAKMAKSVSKSGALYVRFFGESIVISLVTDLIEEAAEGPSWIYTRGKSTEGIIKIPAFSVHAEKLLKLKQKLGAAGADTSRRSDSMDKFMIRIYRELHELLADEVSVRVQKKGPHPEAPRELILLKSGFHNKPSQNDAAS